MRSRQDSTNSQLVKQPKTLLMIDQNFVITFVVIGKTFFNLFSDKIWSLWYAQKFDRSVVTTLTNSVTFDSVWIYKNCYRYVVKGGVPKMAIVNC